jgi:hypothetical protein
VKPIPHRHHAAGKRKIRRRLDRPVTAPSLEPVITARNIQYETATKVRAIPCGGIGAIQLLVRKLGLDAAIDERLQLLKRSVTESLSEFLSPVLLEWLEPHPVEVQPCHVL